MLLMFLFVILFDPARAGITAINGLFAFIPLEYRGPGLSLETD
jgi:hypothetical protein